MSIRPVYSHDRTIITVVVLVVGAVLIWRFGDASPVMSAIAAAWTLVLTFWFRTGPDQNGGHRT